MKLFLLLLCLTAASTSGAADAVFSQDGKWIYFREGKEVVHYDFEAMPSKRPPSPRTAFPAEVQGLARLPSGDIAVASSNKIWRWEPAKGVKGIHEWAVAPKGVSLRGLAQGGKDGPLIAWAGGLWVVRPEKAKLEQVTTRRVGLITSLCVNEHGEVIFSTEGDLWHGKIEMGSDTEPPCLWAHRWLAVAEQETDAGNSSGQGARHVECSGGRVFFAHSRMGGSGWGSLLSVPAPQGKFQDLAVADLLAEAGRASKDLWDMEGTNGAMMFLTTTPDGTETYYKEGSGKHFLQCEKPAAQKAPGQEQPKAHQ